MEDNGGNRDKRAKGPSLSIVNSVDVLRNRYALELLRREAMDKERQISENRKFMESLGKRAHPDRRLASKKDDAFSQEEQSRLFQYILNEA